MSFKYSLMVKMVINLERDVVEYKEDIKKDLKKTLEYPMKLEIKVVRSLLLKPKHSVIVI